ncbi:DNA adenine methylase [Arthrobacter sp. SLBN-112]|uniref:DNA adenine methylase n=1 Tax=Arthrobacter sp. SLBN-112 TaxID=2768452 RepID=UPI00190F6486|nr:DNA adenine methylase [Arthrobacter sp. SLBN-112]
MSNTLTVLASRRYGTLSPLRYPGGKASLAGFFADLIRNLGLRQARYVEPYAGGAGAGIALLREGIVDHLVINDIDPAVHAFWHSVVDNNSIFVDLVKSTPLSIVEWQKQREISGRGPRRQAQLRIRVLLPQPHKSLRDIERRRHWWAKARRKL